MTAKPKSYSRLTVRLVMGVVALAVLAVPATPAFSQEVTAEVRTWQGQTWRLTQTSLEAYSTLVPPPKEGAPGAGPEGAEQMGAGAGLRGLRLFGSAQTLSAMFAKGPEPVGRQARVDVLTLYRAGAETKVPVEKIASLAFFRQPVKDSTLPPYVTDSHVHYSATAVLTDGSRVEGDYVNLGSTFFRGMTPQGRVDIPWDSIEIIRFQR